MEIAEDLDLPAACAAERIASAAMVDPAGIHITEQVKTRICEKQ